MQNADFISIYKGFDAFDFAQFNVESYQLLEVHISVYWQLVGDSAPQALVKNVCFFSTLVIIRPQLIYESVFVFCRTGAPVPACGSHSFDHFRGSKGGIP